MSMGYVPCSGYIMSLKSAYIKGFRIIIKNESAQETIDSEDYADATEFYDDVRDSMPDGETAEVYVTPNLKIDAEIMYYSNDNGGCYDGLESDFYLIFDDDDLFIREPSPALMAMKEKDAAPIFSQWTVFG